MTLPLYAAFTKYPCRAISTGRVAACIAAACIAFVCAVCRADPPADALTDTWGEIEYACYPDRQGFVTLARRIPDETEWESVRSEIRASRKNLRMTIDGSGRIHIVFGSEGGPLRYAFTFEQGGLELTPTMPMTGYREESVRQALLFTLPDGDVAFIYDSEPVKPSNMTINRYSSPDGAWVRIHDTLFDPMGKSRLKWKAVTDTEGVIHLKWTGVGDKSKRKKMYEAHSDNGGITWQTPDGENLDLPIKIR